MLPAVRKYPGYQEEAEEAEPWQICPDLLLQRLLLHGRLYQLPMAEPIPARATEIAAPNNAQTIPLIILILLNIYIFCIFAEWVELFSPALKEFAEELYVL